MVLLLNALSAVIQNSFSHRSKSTSVFKTYFARFSPACAPSRAWNAKRLLYNWNFVSIQCKVIPTLWLVESLCIMYKTSFWKSKISICMLLRNGIMFLVLQQSNAKLTLPLWFCNVVRNGFTATIEWLYRRRQMIFPTVVLQSYAQYQSFESICGTRNCQLGWTECCRQQKTWESVHWLHSEYNVSWSWTRTLRAALPSLCWFPLESFGILFRCGISWSTLAHPFLCQPEDVERYVYKTCMQ